MGALSGHTLLEERRFSSPQQLLKTTRAVIKEEDARKKSLSRSPARIAEDKDSAVVGSGEAVEEMDSAELKAELLKLPEQAQARILNIRNEEPAKYSSARAMRQLIADVVVMMPKEAEAPDLLAPSMAPFGKAAKKKTQHGEPYLTHMPIEGGGSFVMSMTPPKTGTGDGLPISGDGYVRI